MGPEYAAKTNAARRSFLRWSVALTINLTAVGSLSARHAYSTEEQDSLKFLYLDGLGPQLPAANIENQYCPLHQPRSLPEAAISDQQRNYAKAELMAAFDEQGEAWRDYFLIKWTSCHYGVTGDLNYCRQLLEYCKQVYQYLYNDMRDLFPVELNWQLLDKNACTDGRIQEFRAYVGRYTYLLTRVQAECEELSAAAPHLIHATPLERAVNFIRPDPIDFTPVASTIYIIPGLTALISPFSELLHLSTNAPTLHYAKHLQKSMPALQAREKARQFGELFTEALAIHSARNFLHLSNHNDKLQVLSFLSRNLGSYLPHFDDMLGFIKLGGQSDRLSLPDV